MSMLNHRLQVLIEPTQYERLQRVARRRGLPIAAVVRDSIERTIESELDSDLGRRRAAWERLKKLGPIPVPDDPDELERELDGMFDADVEG